MVPLALLQHIRHHLRGKSLAKLPKLPLPHLAGENYASNPCQLRCCT
jgi:hypothetical protein